MAKPLKYSAFKDTGFPAICETAIGTTSKVYVNAPGAGRHILLLGVIAGGSVIIRKGVLNSSTPLMTLISTATDYSASFNFPGAVDVGENTGVYVTNSDGEDMILFYHIWNSADDV